MTSLPLLFTLAVATVPPEYLIVPGKAVGPVRIGMTQAQVHASWGKPTHSSAAPRQRGLLFKGAQPAFVFDEWADGYEDYAGRIVYYVKGKAYQIEVQNPRYRLASGMGTSELPPDWCRSFYGPFQFRVFIGNLMLSYQFIMFNRLSGFAVRFNPPQNDEEFLFCCRPYQTYVAVFAPGTTLIVADAVRRFKEVEEDLKNMPIRCDHKTRSADCE